jgi:hypothetical protein
VQEVIVETMKIRGMREAIGDWFQSTDYELHRRYRRYEDMLRRMKSEHNKDFYVGWLEAIDLIGSAVNIGRNPYKCGPFCYWLTWVRSHKAA